jgi:hypothetical protein
MRLALIAAALLLGLCGGFWVGQTYGQLQMGCALTQGVTDLRGVAVCAGGPGPLARYVLTRDADE